MISTNILAQGEIGSYPTSPRAEYAIDPETNQKIKELYFVLKNDDTKQHGKYRAFNSENILIREGLYNKGQKYGIWKTYYTEPPNELRAEGRYTNNKKSGTWKYYYNTADKKLKEEVSYSENAQTITIKRFDASGLLTESGEAKNIRGKVCETGKWTYYYSGGQKKAEGMFQYAPSAQKSIKVNQWTTYYPNGAKKYEENYNAEGLLHGKKTYYKSNKEIEKYEHYSNGRLKSTENSLTFQKQKFEKLFAEAEKFKNGLNAVFENEIAELKKEYEACINAPKKDEQNFKKGKKIMAQIEHINKQYDKLIGLLNKLDEKAKNVILQYQKSFPEIYKNELLPYNNQVEAVRAIPYIAQIEEPAKKIIEKLEYYEKKIPQLKELDEYILKKQSEIDEKYKTNFPLVYEKSVAPITQSDEYKNEQNLNEKIEKGTKIKEELKKLDKHFEKIKTLDVEIVNQKVVVINYKKKYKAIFKNISPLIDNGLNKYQETENLDEKIKTGDALLKFLKRLEEDYREINSQMTEISTKWDNFTARFQNDDKDDKIIYRKAKILYELYLEAIEKQAASNSRLSYGKLTLKTLDKLLSFYGKDNSNLIKKLKKAESPKQIKETFGIED